jgi:hypothetical protein
VRCFLSIFSFISISRSTGPAASHPDSDLASISVVLGVLVLHLFGGTSSGPVSDSAFSPPSGLLRAILLL